MITHADYEERRATLLELIRQNSSLYFEPRLTGKVGLLNQGATCYLNALLQALNSDKEFLQFLFKTDIPESDKIVKELRVLFANLEWSLHATVSTKTLTMAFGWDQSMSSEQSDIHELWSVLVEALCSISEDFRSRLMSHFAGLILSLTEHAISSYVSYVLPPALPPSLS